MKENKKQIYMGKLSTAQLTSGLKYQREIDNRKVAKIVSNFDPHKFGIIKVSERDGDYYVFDGQHRVTAIKLVNGGADCVVDCEIHTGLSYKEEARLFAEQYDGATTVDTVYRFRALYEAEDKDVVTMINMIEEAGLYPGFNKAKKDGAVLCFSTIIRLIRKVKLEKMEKVFDIITQAWGGTSTSLDKEIIAGVAEFVRVYDKSVDTDILIRKLSKVDPVVIKRRGQSDLSTKNLDIKYAKIILSIYNERLRKGKLDYKFRG